MGFRNVFCFSLRCRALRPAQRISRRGLLDIGSDRRIGIARIIRFIMKRIFVCLGAAALIVLDRLPPHELLGRRLTQGYIHCRIYGIGSHGFHLIRSGIGLLVRLRGQGIPCLVDLLLRCIDGPIASGLTHDCAGFTAGLLLSAFPHSVTDGFLPAGFSYGAFIHSWPTKFVSA